jgi:hypothetical protein
MAHDPVLGKDLRLPFFIRVFQGDNAWLERFTKQDRPNDQFFDLGVEIQEVGFAVVEPPLLSFLHELDLKPVREDDLL